VREIPEVSLIRPQARSTSGLGSCWKMEGVS
jgi:hypothetical protein